MDDLQHLPADVSSISFYCEDHNQTYQKYCRLHEVPLCITCTKTSHKECKDIATIDEAARNFKSSLAMEGLQQKLKEVVCNLQEINKHQKLNVASLMKQKHTKLQEIAKIRSEINNHLDHIEEEIEKELNSVVDKNRDKMLKLIDELKSKEAKMKKFQDRIIHIKEHASDKETLIQSKSIEKTVSQEQHYILSLFESNDLDVVRLNCHIDDRLASLGRDIAKYGKIYTETTKTKLTLYKPDDKQAQVPRMHAKSSVILLNKFTAGKDSSTPVVTGLTFLPDNKIIFTAFSSDKLFVHSPDLKFLFYIQTGPLIALERNLADVAYIGDNKVAVTSSMNNVIRIVDVAKKKLIKTIKTEYSCHGTAYYDGSLIYTHYNQGIMKTNLTDFISSVFFEDKDISFGSSVTVVGKNVCFSSPASNTVTLLDSNSKVIWLYKNVDLLKEPSGVTADNEGNIYVAGHETNNVVLVSHDGKHGRQLLGCDDGIQIPYCIYFHKIKDQLIVVHSCDNVFVYQCDKNV